MRFNQRYLGLVVLCVLTMFVFPFLGSENLAVESLLEKGSPSHRIFFELRLPRLVLITIVGASLSVLGATYQSLFRNPIAEPYVLGSASAVILGIVVSHVFFGAPTDSFVALGAGFLLSVLSAVLLLSLCQFKAQRQMERVILFGMGLNFFLSSLLFMLLSYFNQTIGGGSLRWLFGNIPWLGWGRVTILLLLSIPFFLFLLISSRSLDALSLGDTTAKSLGFEPKAVRTRMILVSSAFLSVIVALTGAIGFVGLVVPHGMRLLLAPRDTRALYLVSMAAGAAFLALSDILSRSLLYAFEFPIGVITSLVGGPLFLYLLWKR